MFDFPRFSLARQFLVASFPILLLGMLAIGLWVAVEIERGVVNRLGSVTSLYVDSLVAPHLQQLMRASSLDSRHKDALDAILTDTPLGQKIVAFNIWHPDGRVLYSTDASLTGKTFPVGEGLATALRGEVYSKIVKRTELDHGTADDRWPSRVIETYTPVHAQTLGDILGAAEFYQTTDELTRETSAAQLRSWLVVAAAMAAMYLLLFGLVRRGSKTIDTQRRELRERVADLSTLLERNAQLDAKVRAAAARTTSINEHQLRRIATDLHDGPGQDLGFALMRLETIANRRGGSADPGITEITFEDLAAVRSGLESALTDLRSISAGLRLPDIDGLSTFEVAARAVRDYEHKTGTKIDLVTAGQPSEAALAVKIALYRLLQESLANGFRHAGGVDQRVALTHAGSELHVEVSDQGPGFDIEVARMTGHVGLVGMRERVQALGGSFELHAPIGKGTAIRAVLPLSVPKIDDD